MRLVWIVCLAIFVSITGISESFANNFDLPITTSNFQITDFSGNKLNKIPHGQQVLVEIQLSNNFDVGQEFVYNVSFENENGIKNDTPSWVEGFMPPSYSFSPSVANEFPTSGEYTITVEIWNNRDEQNLIAPVTSYSIIVEPDPNSPSPESVVTGNSSFSYTVSNFQITDFYGNVDENLSGKKFFIELDITNNLDVTRPFVYSLTFENENGIKNIEPYLIPGNLPESYTFSASHTLEFPSPGKYVITIKIWNNDKEKIPIAQTTFYDVIVEPNLSEQNTDLTKPIASFVDQTKDPQYYIDRYNNEESYKEWFDDNFSEYDSIYEAVGLDESEISISKDNNLDESTLETGDTILESTPYTGDTMKHLFTFGDEVKDEEFDRPSDIVIDKNNKVYVLDRGNNRIHIFSDEQEHLFSFGESIENQFGYITDIEVDDSGKIYVCDDGEHKIHVFSDSGEPLFSFGEKGIGEGKLYRPQGLAIGFDSRIYVTDSGNNRVQVFSDSGDSIFSFGEKGSRDGEFLNTNGIDIDSDGNVYVVDRGNSRVQIFTSDGEHLLSFGEYGRGGGYFGLAYDVKVDDEKNIYVSNEANRQIQVYSFDGIHLYSFGSFDVGAANRFQSVMGLTLDVNDTLYAVDAGKKNIKVFGKSIDTKTTLTIEHVLYIGLDDAKIKELYQLQLESIMSGSEVTMDKYEELDIELSSALDISVDSEGKMFVADNRKNLIKVFSDKGEYLYDFGVEPGFGTGDLAMLIGMGMDSQNNLYVANTGHDIVQVFSNDGKFLYDFGSKGTGDGELDTPIDVAIDDDGLIYVVDSGDPGIRVFSNDGVYISDMDPYNDYSYSNPKGIDIDDDGKIYVVNEFYVMVFSSERDFLYGFGNGDPNPDERKRNAVNGDVSVDKDGRIYVSDRNNAIVNIFSNDGVYLHTIDGSESPEGKFNMPLDVEVDDNGKVYVADHGKTQIRVFLLDDDNNNDSDNNDLDHSMEDEVVYEKIIEEKSSKDTSFFENLFGFFKSLFG